ncbi:kinase-like domain-containing protein [Paraphysoderma sedebokerense]|nr:kinase-like domain-containing protein [Paraphysoderma sedebokerense]
MKYSACYCRAINIETNQTFAIKKIPLDARAKKEVEKLKKEVKVFQKLSHPNIVHYEGFVQTEDDFNIILEYVENGSLAHTLKNFGPLPEKMVVNNVIKICEGLGYLHEHGLMHLDLKAANILTTKNGEVKLSDFGVSLAINGSYTENERFVGTAYWMAPEIIELSGPTPASDIWSLGCTIIELVTGKPPYSELLTMAALFRIVEDDMPPIPEDLSKELKDFLMKCFNKDPSKRWSAKGLLEHEWLEPHVKVCYS